MRRPIRGDPSRSCRQLAEPHSGLQRAKTEEDVVCGSVRRYYAMVLYSVLQYRFADIPPDCGIFHRSMVVRGCGQACTYCIVPPQNWGAGEPWTPTNAHYHHGWYQHAWYQHAWYQHAWPAETRTLSISKEHERLGTRPSTWQYCSIHSSARLEFATPGEVKAHGNRCVHYHTAPRTLQYQLSRWRCAQAARMRAGATSTDMDARTLIYSRC